MFQIIFAEECTEAENRSWHLHHFTCFECDKSLGGTRYVMREDRPYCLECFEGLFAENCSTCKKPISNDEARMSHGSRQWHASNKCFVCANCRVGLLGEPFLPREEGIFCSLKCSKNKICESNVRKTRSHSAASRSRKAKIPTDSPLKCVEYRSDDESDYESISPRLQRMNAGRNSTKQGKIRKRSINNELMARSVVTEKKFHDTQVTFVANFNSFIVLKNILFFFRVYLLIVHCQT